jgi:membrane-bound metal-dependent hydrolase YbcI (DUF457 family)
MFVAGAVSAGAGIIHAILVGLVEALGGDDPTASPGRALLGAFAGVVLTVSVPFFTVRGARLFVLVTGVWVLAWMGLTTPHTGFLFFIAAGFAWWGLVVVWREQE